MAHATINFSVTEMPHFRRLVNFMVDVEQLADERCDLELHDLVEEARDDLLQMANRNPRA